MASRINQAIDLAKERAQPEKDRIIPGSNAGHLGERDIGDVLVVISCKPRLCALENAFSWEEKAPVKRLSNGERSQPFRDRVQRCGFIVDGIEGWSQ
ncbi:hypothetical protein AB4Z52_06435 [Rhizobium sp. 2YAF20]|uniref:hypothetical protein n=1 Tax=Rhizobium sp. 2YAF20 TaxID=3233027 RepID=UPI003F9E66CF